MTRSLRSKARDKLVELRTIRVTLRQLPSLLLAAHRVAQD
jgi:hypothetical protein